VIYKEKFMSTRVCGVSVSGGKFSASARSFKMEALIQLMPYDVELIAAQTIAAFDKKMKYQ
jgi:hypothetical protein